jgi:hypothetical protein
MLRLVGLTASDIRRTSSVSNLLVRLIGSLHLRSCRSSTNKTGCCEGPATKKSVSIRNLRFRLRRTRRISPRVSAEYIAELATSGEVPAHDLSSPQSTLINDSKRALVTSPLRAESECVAAERERVKWIRGLASETKSGRSSVTAETGLGNLCSSSMSEMHAQKKHRDRLQRSLGSRAPLPITIRQRARALAEHI